MFSYRQKIAGLALSLLALQSVPAFAQSAEDYPNQTVRIITPFEAGGGTDIVSRELANKLQGLWNNNAVIVENKPGANGNLGTDIVAKSKPDGYSLLLTTNATIAINPQLFGDRVKYDPIKDFTPVSMLSSLPFVFLVPPASPAKTMEEFLELAKKSPGTLSCGSSGVGGGAHLALEMLKSRAGVDITHIPYKGTGSSITALLGDHIDCLFVSILSASPYIKQGQLRALAVSSLDRNSSLPDVPAVAELPGLDGFESDLWYGLLVPTGTDPKIVQKVYEGVKALIDDPGFRGRFEPTGAVLVGNKPEEFAKQVASDIKKWATVVKESGVAEQL
ncbi:Bug family tripartite tricarboxylate transporter substrate binding protein [Shinella lacus]|uniref:Tripartite tricarboxylate transporter substrate binding protein n=1 Tax=Shinella lacus TaxID=2654216 RepID=A0ABT1R1X8_9HYPH|nr:tripartite tricarboxylate transporter substrate binding protein [Shinella lacus]MCQ4629188.1 tripartite tricarboxylate transporter substrate binding protein [Shinella lacus]